LWMRDARSNEYILDTFPFVILIKSHQRKLKVFINELPISELSLSEITCLEFSYGLEEGSMKELLLSKQVRDRSRLKWILKV
jgi:predicted nucleic acid-binding protein